MQPENALVSRRVFKVGDGNVVVEERWDTKHPECPFVAVSGLANNPHVVQTVMSEEEFDAKGMKMKPHTESTGSI